MSENNNSFDDLIRKKFENDREPVESFVWDAIEKQLPVGESKKRFAYWRLVSLMLLLFIPAALIYFYQDLDKKEELVTRQVKGGVTKEVPLSEIEIKKSAENNLHNIKETSQSPEAIETIISETEKPVTENTRPIKKNVLKENKIRDSKADDVATVVSSDDESYNSLQSNYSIALPDSGISILNIQANQPDNGASSNFSVASNAIELNTMGVAQSDSTINIKPEISKPDSLVPQIVKSKNWFVEIFYAPEYAKKTFELNSEDANYLKLRKNTEQFVYAHSYGIRAGYKIGNKTSLKTGLDFTELQYQLTYGYFPGQVPLPAGLKIDSITGIVVDPLNNGIVTSNDTIVANYELVGQTSETNHYRMYNVPLIFSYAISKRKMKVETNAGGFINIVSKQKGSIIGQDRISRINLKEDRQRTPYKSVVGGGICAEVLMTYSIRSQIKFIIGPNVKYYLGKLNKSNAPLNEKLFTSGLLTGFRVEF